MARSVRTGSRARIVRRRRRSGAANRLVPSAATSLVVVAGLALAACGEDAPDAAGVVSGPVVYEARCASCHGADLGGGALGPSLRSELYGPEQFTDDQIRASISQGAEQVNWEFGPMPMVSGLSAAEIDAVVAHVRGVQAAEGLEPFPPD
jgi:mono/diheme cytochrome c family protein